MEREFTFIIGPNGSVSFAAYCLRTDSWHDYVAFMGDAERAVATSDRRGANRFLRAALTCLFSHVEGVVNEIYDRKQIPNFFRGGGLGARTRNIAREARKTGRLPYVDFRFEKYLRDLIAHPGIIKAFTEEDGESTAIDQTSVFERLDVPTLRRLEGMLSPWLDAVCRNLAVPRFTDTKKRAERAIDLLEELGGTATISEV